MAVSKKWVGVPLVLSLNEELRCCGACITAPISFGSSHLYLQMYMYTYVHQYLLVLSVYTLKS